MKCYEENGYRLKPTFATRVTRAAVHTDSKFGCDCLCRLAEALAPGFTECVWLRIESRVRGDWASDAKWKARALSCFRRRRYALFAHAFLLWVGVRLVERHDPFSLSDGDEARFVGKRRR